jgi:hypothetical protein
MQISISLYHSQYFHSFQIHYGPLITASDRECKANKGPDIVMEDCLLRRFVLLPLFFEITF